LSTSGRRRSPGAALVAMPLLVAFAVAPVGVASARTTATRVVDVGPGSFFSPPTQTAAPGDMVRWDFQGGTHTTTRTLMPKEWNSGNRTSGSFSQTFPTAGTFRYWCTIHGGFTFGMRGWIVVGSAPTVTIDDASVTEGTGGSTNLVFPITLSAPAPDTVTIGYLTQTGTASSGDFTGATDATTQIATGQTSGSISIPITTDSADENDETFKVLLSGSQNAMLDTVAAGATDATGTISDDDGGGGGTPMFSIANASLTEGDAGTSNMTFTVTASPAPTSPESVQFATSNGTATQPADYTSTGGTLNFAAGDGTEQFMVPVEGDVIDEAHETFTVTLSNPSAGTAISDGTATGTITDDDTATLAIADGSDGEGDSGADSEVSLAVTLSTPSASAVTVHWATVSTGSATPGSDYETDSGDLTFTAGSTTPTSPPSVTVHGDDVDETNETFRVDLSSPSGAAVSDGQGTFTIVDDDGGGGGGSQIAVGNDTTPEPGTGTASMEFTIFLLDGTAATDITVDWQTANGSATAGSDYTAD
jgi:plastocyanin